MEGGKALFERGDDDEDRTCGERRIAARSKAAIVGDSEPVSVDDEERDLLRCLSLYVQEAETKESIFTGVYPWKHSEMNEKFSRVKLEPSVCTVRVQNKHYLKIRLACDGTN